MSKPPRGVIRVLVVDDSAYVRKVVRTILMRSPLIEVVGTARDGEEALEQVEALSPDVVLLDLMMPRLDGVGFLHAQMGRYPIPVLVLSIASEHSEMALEALDAGAIDLIQKPTALASEQLYDLAQELIEKVKQVAGITPRSALPLREARRPVRMPLASVRAHRVDAVVMGASTGGPRALRQVISQLPADLAVPVAIVLHMPLGYTELYARRLDRITSLAVKEAEEGEPMEPGKVLIARAGRHLVLKQRSPREVVAHLDSRPLDTPHRPSVDVLFRSAAQVYGDRVLGVVMTGMGADGAQGAAWIKAQGGMIFTEAEETCVVYGMPRTVAELGLSDRVVPLDDLASMIVEVV